MERPENDPIRVKTILIVDDEPTLRMVAADFLIDAGFEAVEAGSADEAILILEQREDVTLIFTDVQMPGSMDGVGLATIVTLRWPHIRLIITSGNLQPSHRPLPPQAIFLSKPYHLPAVARLAQAA
jgi:CheY-like chemotaxis protein